MIVLHEYPLSIDHAGFQRFVSALQPLFKIGTRNTIRKDILMQYQVEKKKAIDYMAGIDSRVAITTDLWTSDNQKRGYIAITAHFVDESWTLKSIIMRFIYVPAPHTADVICEVLYESLVDWNLDEKISTVTHENCTTNDTLKTLSLLMCFEWLLGTTGDVCEDKVAEVMELLRALMNKYHVEEAERTNTASSIPMVASESIFSTIRRVLSEHRSRLTPQMIEALMCSQNWLRNKYKADDMDDKGASFWSCLQNIREGLQELAI